MKGPPPISGYTRQEISGAGGPTFTVISFFGTNDALEAVKRARGEGEIWWPGLFGCKDGSPSE